MKRVRTFINAFIWIFVTSLVCLAQSTPFNLDFENIVDKSPVGWQIAGSKHYSTYIDSAISKKGKNSAVIEYHGDSPQFKVWVYSIPAKYEGKKIKLSGFLKTENVTGGYAGLWMQIKPSVGFDNMRDRGVKGTTDWKRYEVELDLKSNVATSISFGGILSGKGKMWIDNLQITIDGLPLSKTPLKKLPPAKKDKEFDKGSRVSIGKLDEKLTSGLELLGRIWGFLKYHHPAIAKGNHNWDYELFRVLPKFLTANNNSEREVVLLAWINSLGEVSKYDACVKSSTDAVIKPDLRWMNEMISSNKLRTKLHFIDCNRHQGNHFYIAMTPKIGNPNFKNENSYSYMPFPDEGFRLLTLYKYWNIINYFYPNKHLTDKDWNSVLSEYIPKFLNAKNELEYELAAIEIIGSIKDTHAKLFRGNNAFQEKIGKFYPPFGTRFIENKLVITEGYNPDFVKKTGLRIGDAITEINGKAVEEIVKEMLPFYPGSNSPTQLRDISIDILRSTLDKTLIGFVQDGTKLSKEISLYERKDLDITNWYESNNTDKSFRLLNGNIGYISLRNIRNQDIVEIKKQFRNTKGIIIDIRNYPMTYVVYSLGSFFVRKDTPFVKFRIGSVDTPGEFTLAEPLKVGSENTDYYKGRVIVIVNELTQSQAEYTAMVFQARDNTTVLGSTTAGADGNVSLIKLPGGLQTWISGIGVLYPDGTETQRIGIVPDVEVKPTIEGIRNGKDELLEKAIELINENKK